MTHKHTHTKKLNSIINNYFVTQLLLSGVEVRVISNERRDISSK